ncbi:MAG TPA: ABC transporter substrate-binding protein, partial [Chloroflexota bacterium]
MEPRPLRNVPAKTALIACLAPLLIATACATPGGPPSQAGGGPASAGPKRLIAAIHGNPTSILYSLNSGGGGRVDGGMELQGLVNSGMAVQTSGGEWTPVLAEAIPSVDNGLWKIFPDGRSETTWKIRSGATWHDGAPLTGDDFVFTVQLSRDKNMPWLVDPNLSLIDSADSLDPSTVRIAWKQPYIRADQMFGKGSVSVVYPKHILEEPYTRGAGQNISNLSYFTSEYIGTGPFKEKEWVIDQRVTLTAFDGYAPGRPKVDELEVRFIPDAQTIAANILSDTVDFTLGPGLALEEGLAARDRWPQGTMQIGVSGNISMNPQFLNPDPPILANVQFRKALYMSINRQELVDTLTYGLSRPLDANVSPEEPEFKAVQSQIVRYQFDPTKAQQMITDLGYTRGTNGMFADSAGSPLVIQIMATTDD